GLPVKSLYLGIVCSSTLVIVASMQIVGVLLVIALLIGPAITAYLLVKELHEMMIVGSVLGAISTISGMYASYYLDLPSGAAIVMVILLIFILAFLFSPRQGVFKIRNLEK
ncbi:MAG: metal ABC transporter permease, partial [Cyanobacteria bacterium J083]